MKKEKERSLILRSLMSVTQLGIQMLAPILLCVAAGAFLDGRFGTSLTLPLLLLGVAAGARNAWRMAKHLQEAGEDHEDDTVR